MHSSLFKLIFRLTPNKLNNSRSYLNKLSDRMLKSPKLSNSKIKRNNGCLPRNMTASDNIHNQNNKRNKPPDTYKNIKRSFRNKRNDHKITINASEFSQTMEEIDDDD